MGASCPRQEALRDEAQALPCRSEPCLRAARHVARCAPCRLADVRAGVREHGGARSVGLRPALDLLDDVPVRYYRDDSGVEADAIVQLADGRWAAFEFKVSEDKVEKGVASLERMRRKVCENPRSQTRPPEFMAVITGVGEYAREVAEGIVAVPIRLLGK